MWKKRRAVMRYNAENTSFRYDEHRDRAGRENEE